MRESLTILAILLIVVLTTALVGPYFVDWNAHRGEIEARLSTLLGAKVAIAGPIDVKLLPRPIFKLQQVTVSGGSPRDGLVRADRIDVELALTAVLRGEIRFVDVDITRPRLTLTVGADRSVVLPGLAGTDPDRVSVGSIEIHDGTLVLVGGPTARPVTITGLEGQGEADSLNGPFKFDGRVDTTRGPLGFRLATGAYDNRKLRVKTTLDPLAGLPKIDIEGTVSTAPGAGAASALAFDGSLAAASQVVLPGSAAVVPWRLGTHLRAEAGQLDASEVEIRAGADERALVATGAGHIDFGSSEAAHFTLKARQVDLGKLAVPAGNSAAAADNSDPAAPHPLPIDLYRSALKGFAEDADAFAAVPMPVTIDYTADTVQFGAETLTGLNGMVTLAAGKPAIGTVSVEAASDTHLTLDGSFEPGPAAVFKGRLVASSHDLQRFAASVATDFPEEADRLTQAIPAKAFGFDGAVDLSGVGFAAHDLRILLDRSSFSGTMTLTRAVGQDRARFFADLTSEALDLDALPDWRNVAEAAANLDLSLSISARAIRLAHTDTGNVDAGHIALVLNKTGPAVTLSRLLLADIGGATADLSGGSDGKTAHLAGHFDARRLHDLAALIHEIAPNAATELLLGRADRLSPALLQVAASASVEADGTLVPTALSLSGTTAGTKVNLTLKPDLLPSKPGDPLAPFRSGNTPFTASLWLDAPESGALLRQIGVATRASTAIGHGHIEASAHLGSSGGLDGGLTASFGATALTFHGKSGQNGDWSGRLSLRGANVAPVLSAVTLASPEPGAVWPADAEAGIVWRDRRITTQALSGHLIGTGFSGDLSFVVPPPGAGGSGAPALTGSLTIDRLPLSVLGGLALGPLPRPKPGAVWPDTGFAPGFLSLPRAELALSVPDFPLNETVRAHDAKLTLRLAPGVVALADLSGRLGEGRIGGSLTLRRDGQAASLAGQVNWTSLPLATPSLAGVTHGTLGLAGTGNSLLALVSGLAGTGTVAIDDARLPRLDPDAIARVVNSTDSATVDEAEINQALARELDRGALSLGNVSFPVTVAAGVIRADQVAVETPAVSALTSASLELRTLTWMLRTTATERTPPKSWTGSAPQVTVSWKGPFSTPAREVEAAALVNGIEARAIAREQARIEAFQDDIRERAFFARRLKAIEAEQQVDREKAQAEAERRKAAEAAVPQKEPAVKPDGHRTEGTGDGTARPTDGARPAAPQAPALQGLGRPIPRALLRPYSRTKPVELQHGPSELGKPQRPPSIQDPAQAGHY